MKLTAEQARLKQFMLDHFDFDGLKASGFYRGVRRADFQTQADHICHYFSFKTVYEYAADLAEIVDIVEVNDLTGQPRHMGVAVATWPSKVSETGELVQGDSALLSTTEGGFACPHCTCPQNYKAGKGYYKHKCTGCKRSTAVAMDHTGKLHIFES